MEGYKRIRLKYDSENIYEFLTVLRRLGKVGVTGHDINVPIRIDAFSVRGLGLTASDHGLTMTLYYTKDASFPPDLDFSDYKGIAFDKEVHDDELHLILSMRLDECEKNDAIRLIDSLFEALERTIEFNLEGEEAGDPEVVGLLVDKEAIDRISKQADKLEKIREISGESPEEFKAGIECREAERSKACVEHRKTEHGSSIGDVDLDKLIKLTENLKIIGKHEESAGPVLQIKENSTLSFSDIGGYARQLEELKEIARVAADLKVAKTYAIQIDRGILFYGPPGTGKTSAAEALATELGCPFISVSASSILGKFVGESEKAVRKLFLKAIEVKKELDVPVIVFLLDEVGSLLGSHSGSITKADKNVRNEFLSWMDGANRRQHEEDIDGIVLVGTTNHLEEIPSEFRDRPGRFSKLIHFGYPDEEERSDIARILISKRNRIAKEAGSEEDRIDPAFAGTIAAETDEMFVGDKINAILEKALRCAFEERSPVVTKEMLEKAVELVRAQTRKADKKKTRRIGFGSEKAKV